MRVKLYNALHEHAGTYAVWEKNFTRWLDESADTFFAEGGYAEVWNDEDVYRFAPPAHSRLELRSQISDRRI